MSASARERTMHLTTEHEPEPGCWYRDSFQGRTMDRPGWKKLEADLRAGKVSRLVVWRLDRLGRTAQGAYGPAEACRGRPTIRCYGMRIAGGANVRSSTLWPSLWRWRPSPLQRR